MDESRDIDNQLQIDDGLLIENGKENAIKKIPLSWRDIQIQVISSFVISISMAQSGLVNAFPNLMTNDFDQETKSWIASLPSVSVPLGSFLAGPIIDKFGRKISFILIEIVCIISWLLVAFADKDRKMQIYIGLFIGGTARGAMTTNGSIYISETTHSSYRQLFLAMMTFFYAFGVLAVSLISIVFTWDQASFCFAAFMFINILAVLPFPESPHWLAVIKMDMNKAERAMKTYNPNVMVFEKEWKLLKYKIHTQTMESSRRPVRITSPCVYKPVLLSAGLMLLQQLSAIFPLTSFTNDMSSRIGHKTGEEHSSRILIASSGIRLLICLVNIVLLLKVTQKSALIISGFGMLAACLMYMANVLLARVVMVSTTVTDWISIIALIFYMTANCFGTLGIPFTIVSELLPTEVRAKGLPVLLSFACIQMTVYTKVFLSFVELLGVFYFFVYLTVISVLVVVFVYVCIPNINGKSLTEIENYFTTGKFKVDHS